MNMQEIIKKNILLRYELLKTLYEYESQNKSFSWENFSEDKEYSKEEVRKALKFLNEEYQIEYIQTLSGFLNIHLTSTGSKLVEEIEQAKSSDKSSKDKVINWTNENVSWITPIIMDLVKG